MNDQRKIPFGYDPDSNERLTVDDRFDCSPDFCVSPNLEEAIQPIARRLRDIVREDVHFDPKEVLIYRTILAEGGNPDPLVRGCRVFTSPSEGLRSGHEVKGRPTDAWNRSLEEIAREFVTAVAGLTTVASVAIFYEEQMTGVD